MSKKQKVIYVGGEDEGEWRYREFHGQGTYTCDGLNEYLSEWDYGVQVEKGIFPFLRQHC